MCAQHTTTVAMGRPQPCEHLLYSKFQAAQHANVALHHPSQQQRSSTSAGCILKGPAGQPLLPALSPVPAGHSPGWPSKHLDHPPALHLIITRDLIITGDLIITACTHSCIHHPSWHTAVPVRCTLAHLPPAPTTHHVHHPALQGASDVTTRCDRTTYTLTALNPAAAAALPHRAPSRTCCRPLEGAAHHTRHLPAGATNQRCSAACSTLVLAGQQLQASKACQSQASSPCDQARASGGKPPQQLQAITAYHSSPPLQQPRPLSSEPHSCPRAHSSAALRTLRVLLHCRPSPAHRPPVRPNTTPASALRSLHPAPTSTHTRLQPPQ